MNAPQPAPRKPIIGLIGGIGAGKSTVAQRLRELGATVIDADKTGHEVLRLTPVKKELTTRLGDKILGPDGEIDRKQLGEIVFSDEAKRKTLEGVVHAAMAERFREQISMALMEARVPMIVLDAAILLEVGWNAICDEIVFVDAPRELRLDRLQKNRGWNEEELDRRERAQWPLDRKRAQSDVLIDNSGDETDCRQQVDDFFRRRVAAPR